MIRTSRLLSVTVAGLMVLAACGDDSTAQPASSNAPAASDGLSPEPGAVLPDGCAAPDGSSAKQQQFTAAPPMCLLPGKTYTATIETNQGTVRVALRNDIAPNTVNSFVNLARFHYFDGTTCHRAIRNFVVQCGDPTASGSGGPGYEFADELDKIDGYRIGSVAMANAGPNTNGSQFFIISGPDGCRLPPQYSLFGQVVKGLDVVEKMQNVPTGAGDRPKTDVVINSVTVTVAD